MTAMKIIQALGSVLVVITAISYFYQIAYLFVPLLVKPRQHKAEKLHRYAILIAARNEEAVLPHLLESIARQDYPAHLITTFVVADNCTDRTAEVAAKHGARVCVRFNNTQVGKGYALQYLLQQLDRSEFDAFLIFDADNLLRPDYIRSINRVCCDGYDAFCGYRNSKNFGSNWLSACHGLLFLHESTHMNRSRMLLGTNCAVSGTGFGFTRPLLERMGGWNYFTLTEDLEFSTWCASNGVRIGYSHDAVLYDEQPTVFRQSWRQRTRWAQGGIQVSFRYFGRLLRGLFRGGRTSYACFESLTLSLWGYSMAAISCAITIAITFLTERWLGLAQALAVSLITTYASMFVIGALTLLTENRRIHGTKKQKIIALFTFPIFMMSFIPIAVSSVFRKFHWPPIAHTVAISANSLAEK